MAVDWFSCCLGLSVGGGLLVAFSDPQGVGRAVVTTIFGMLCMIAIVLWVRENSPVVMSQIRGMPTGFSGWFQTFEIMTVGFMTPRAFLRFCIWWRGEIPKASNP